MGVALGCIANCCKPSQVRSLCPLAGFGRSADCKSAIRQIGNLRYGLVSSAIGFCEQRHRVDDPEFHALQFGAVDELEEAAWVAVGDDAGTG
jgi:hypothetical protein